MGADLRENKKEEETVSGNERVIDFYVTWKQFPRYLLPAQATLHWQTDTEWIWILLIAVAHLIMNVCLL